MSAKAKRSLSVVVVLSVVGVSAGAILFLTFLSAPGAGQEAPASPLTDIGRFRVGSELGEGRAGFSGMAKVMVFARSSFTDAERAALASVLQSAEVEAALVGFTPILVDVEAEPTVEEGLRVQAGWGVVVRGLSGGVLGGLHESFTAREFVDFLDGLRFQASLSAEKSPIYGRLLETSAPISDLVAQGERQRAANFVDFLREFEGQNSPAYVSAREALGQ